MWVVRHGRRPIRCGVDGCTSLALLKIDVLNQFPTLRLCTGYVLDGKVLTRMPYSRDLARVQTIEEELPGWECPTTAVRRFDDLPAAAKRYLLRIEELVRVPIQYVGVGAEREALIVRG